MPRICLHCRSEEKLTINRDGYLVCEKCWIDHYEGASIKDHYANDEIVVAGKVIGKVVKWSIADDGFYIDCRFDHVVGYGEVIVVMKMPGKAPKPFDQMIRMEDGSWENV